MKKVFKILKNIIKVLFYGFWIVDKEKGKGINEENL